MRFLAITLNPSFDRTMYFDGFEAGKTNRAVKSVLSLGGKGINCARVLSGLGAEVFCVGFGGRECQKACDAYGLESEFIDTGNPVRENIKIIAGGENTEANEPGFPVPEAAVDKLLSLLFGKIPEYDVIIFGGSFPPSVERKVENSVLNFTEKAKKAIVCDFSGDALKTAVDCGCTLIKPNLRELSDMCGKSPVDIEDLKRTCGEIYSENKTSVLLTLGGGGSFYTGALGEYTCPAEKCESPRSFAGAGDVYLASFLFAVYEKNAPPEVAMKFASSVACEKIKKEGMEMPDKITLRRLAAETLKPQKGNR